MVKHYLLNYQQELLEKKIDLEKSLQKVEILIKENQEFIRFIQNSEDKSYDSFSPHNYKSDSDEKKKKELKEQQKELKEQTISLKNQIEHINQKSNELENIIKLLKTENNKEIDKDDDSEVFRMKLLETQEYERQNIARELQNSTLQSLASMMHKIEICTKLADMDPNRCKLELQNLSKTVKNTIDDMGDVISNLCPMSFDDTEIDTAIKQKLERLQKNNDISINFKTSGSSEGVLPVVGITMLRIIQEACNNTIKHSGAKNILISIEYLDEKIQMEITDDGHGFDVSELKNIWHERIYLLSGMIDIKSEKEMGTKISINIPKK